MGTRLARIPIKHVLDELNIRNYSQLKTWMKWYRDGELHRLEQPVGKQYTFGKGPEYESETAKLQAENRYLKQQIEVLKKYAGLEREWAKSNGRASRVAKRNHADWVNLSSFRYSSFVVLPLEGR